MKTTVLLGALLFAASLAHASPQAAPVTDDNRLDRAWDVLVATEGGLLSDAQAAGLNNLAFQAAASRVCPGRDIDHKRFAIEFDHILLDTASPLSEAQAEERKTALLVAFGARYGIFLAESQPSSEAFCATAAKLAQGGSSVPLVLR